MRTVILPARTKFTCELKQQRSANERCVPCFQLSNQLLVALLVIKIGHNVSH